MQSWFPSLKVACFAGCFLYYHFLLWAVSQWCVLKWLVDGKKWPQTTITNINLCSWSHASRRRDPFCVYSCFENSCYLYIKLLNSFQLATQSGNVPAIFAITEIFFVCQFMQSLVVFRSIADFKKNETLHTEYSQPYLMSSVCAGLLHGQPPLDALVGALVTASLICSLNKDLYCARMNNIEDKAPGFGTAGHTDCRLFTTITFGPSANCWELAGVMWGETVSLDWAGLWTAG